MVFGTHTTTIREFIDAGLVDEMYVAVAPVELGHGARPWETPEDLTDRYHLERVSSDSGVTHHFIGVADNVS